MEVDQRCYHTIRATKSRTDTDRRAAEVLNFVGDRFTISLSALKSTVAPKAASGIVRTSGTMVRTNSVYISRA